MIYAIDFHKNCIKIKGWLPDLKTIHFFAVVIDK